jgi:glucokinase
VLTLGVDIGGTKIAAGLVTPDGNVLAQLTVPTPAARGPAAIIAAIRDIGCALIRRSSEPVGGCGAGSAGVIDPVSGRVVSATSSLPGWAGTELREELAAAFSVPVTVLNDVHAHAVAEARFGAGASSRTMLLVALGTGIGGAFVRDGQVELGRHGAAGHFGHVPAVLAAGVPCPCGKSGHLESVASGPAILARYRAAAGHGDVLVAGDMPVIGDVPDTRDVFRRAAAGDQRAVTCVNDAATAIGEAIGGLVNALDPEIVVVTGGLAFADTAWFERITDTARASAIPVSEDVPITLAGHGASSAIVGAAAWHLERTISQPRRATSQPQRITSELQRKGRTA